MCRICTNSNSVCVCVCVCVVMTPTPQGDEPRINAEDHRPGAGIFWMKPLEVQDVVIRCFPELASSSSDLRGFMQTRVVGEHGPLSPHG